MASAANIAVAATHASPAPDMTMASSRDVGRRLLRVDGSCVARVCDIAVGHLEVLVPIGSQATRSGLLKHTFSEVYLTASMENTRRTMRSAAIPLDDNLTVSRTLRLSFKFQYVHALKSFDNRLVLSLQRRKRYKHRPIKGYKTLASTAISMDQVLQTKVGGELPLVDKHGQLVARVNIKSIASLPASGVAWDEDEEEDSDAEQWLDGMVTDDDDVLPAPFAAYEARKQPPRRRLKKLMHTLTLKRLRDKRFGGSAQNEVDGFDAEAMAALDDISLLEVLRMGSRVESLYSDDEEDEEDEYFSDDSIEAGKRQPLGFGLMPSQRGYRRPSVSPGLVPLFGSDDAGTASGGAHLSSTGAATTATAGKRSTITHTPKGNRQPPGAASPKARQQRLASVGGASSPGSLSPARSPARSTDGTHGIGTRDRTGSLGRRATASRQLLEPSGGSNTLVPQRQRSHTEVLFSSASNRSLTGTKSTGSLSPILRDASAATDIAALLSSDDPNWLLLADSSCGPATQLLELVKQHGSAAQQVGDGAHDATALVEMKARTHAVDTGTLSSVLKACLTAAGQQADDRPALVIGLLGTTSYFNAALAAYADVCQRDMLSGRPLVFTLLPVAALDTWAPLQALAVTRGLVETLPNELSEVLKDGDPRQLATALTDHLAAPVDEVALIPINELLVTVRRPGERQQQQLIPFLFDVELQRADAIAPTSASASNSSGNDANVALDVDLAVDLKPAPSGSKEKGALKAQFRRLHIQRRVDDRDTIVQNVKSMGSHGRRTAPQQAQQTPLQLSATWRDKLHLRKLLGKRDKSNPQWSVAIDRAMATLQEKKTSVTLLVDGQSVPDVIFFNVSSSWPLTVKSFPVALQHVSGKADLGGSGFIVDPAPTAISQRDSTSVV